MDLRAGLAVCLSISLAAGPLAAQQRPAPAQAPTPAPAVPPGRAAPRAPSPTQVQAQGQVRTLQDALASAYEYNPTLQAARAQLRATDEGVATAVAGWRPTVTLSAAGGYQEGNTRLYSRSNFPRLPGQTGVSITKNERPTGNLQALVTQPLYRGGRTRAGTNRAENQVMSQRAQLIATEQTLFGNIVNAYVMVIANQQVLELNTNNEQVLAKQLQATNDRFRVGEITRTDVAQAEAALAGATATRQTAEGNLATSRGLYAQYVGELPGKLVEPQPLKLPARTIDEARALAAANNPNVVSALFSDAAAKDNFDLQYSALLPTVTAQAAESRVDNALQARERQVNTTFTVNLSVPIYQGGSEYAAVRQARQQEQQSRKLIDDARRTAVQALVNSWETYTAAKATIESTRTQIRSNQIALEGVQREAIVGSRTTLDVLNAQQLLLQSRVTLVQNLANFVNASYSVAAAVGRLTARDLNLGVPLYDETAYYTAVRDRWVGTGDFATDQPGR